MDEHEEHGMEESGGRVEGGGGRSRVGKEGDRGRGKEGYGDGVREWEVRDVGTVEHTHTHIYIYIYTHTHTHTALKPGNP